MIGETLEAILEITKETITRALRWVLALGPEWYQQWSFCESKAFGTKSHCVRRYE